MLPLHIIFKIIFPSFVLTKGLFSYWKKYHITQYQSKKVDISKPAHKLLQIIWRDLFLIISPKNVFRHFSIAVSLLYIFVGVMKKKSLLFFFVTFLSMFSAVCQKIINNTTITEQPSHVDNHRIYTYNMNRQHILERFFFFI